MRPGHIQVFDGLRITTEHMKHLQGAFHSAVRDIREILGLGKIYRGFQVTVESNTVISVQPGLAFDFEKNRIVSDEPKIFDVEFGDGEDTKYVCIEYSQVEDCVIEGRPTQVWDSCAVSMRSAMPEPQENLIPIAELVRNTEAGKALEVISLLPTEEKGKAEGGQAEEDDQETEAEIEEEAEDLGEEETEAGAASEESEIAPEEEASGRPEEEDASSAEVSKISELEDEIAPPDETKTPAVVPGQSNVRIQQGVVRLGAAQGTGTNLSALIVEPLKGRPHDEAHSCDESLLVTLAQEEVELAFPVSSLS
jgi:hypothetical protein